MKQLAVVLVLVAACGDDGPSRSVADLQDPETCKECHATHYDDWAMSMHAYASDDPVFVAMNKRGQRETNNSLGTFCVQCHAPMAVALGDTNGLDFDPTKLPATERGITCYFCHNVASIADTHNNGLQIALDQTMRGGIKNPVTTTAHHAKFDPTMTVAGNDSAMCGSCHDVVTPSNVHIERTFEEWKGTIFASDDDKRHLSCNSGCHMQPFDDVVADDPNANVPRRIGGRHDHSFAALDQAMTTFPGQDKLVEKIHGILDPAAVIISPRKGTADPLGGICVSPANTFTVRIDNIGAGHNFPSGAAQDRRMWLEVQAFDASNAVVFSSGVVPDDQDPPPVATANFAGMWDSTFKADLTPAHFFWDVATEQPSTLRPAVTIDPNDPRFDHSKTFEYGVAGTTANIDRIEVKLHLRAFPFATIDELIASGDLDPSFRAKIQTVDPAGAVSTWTRATADAISGCNKF